jgi:hypothetical protein
MPLNSSCPQCEYKQWEQFVKIMSCHLEELSITVCHWSNRMKNPCLRTAFLSSERFSCDIGDFTNWRFGRMFIPHRIHGAAIYGNIYQYTPNVSIYTIHGSYGICSFQLIVGRLSPACPACHWCLSTWHCGAWCLRSCFMMPGPLGVRVLHLRLFRAGRCFLFGFLLFGVGWGFGFLLGAVDGQDSPRNPNILLSRVTFCGKLLDQYHGISWF